MKLTCEIVQDLLPLYEDNICSQDSRDAVEEHLKECPECRKQLESIRCFVELEISVEEEKENKAIIKSFRKVRHRWAMSLIALLLAIPLVMLGVNQYQRKGICFTNIDEILVARKYFQALKNRDYERAAECMDYEEAYNEIQGYLALTPEDMGVKFTPVTVGQEEWIATEEFYLQYKLYEKSELSEQEFWNDAIFNGALFFIPEENWNEARKQKPDLFEEMADGEVILNEIPYERVGTKWGNYITIKGNVNFDMDSAAECCLNMQFVPAEVYKEARSEMEASALEQYQYFQEKYADFSDMTLEEFTNRMKKNYVKQLKQITGLGYEFKQVTFEDSYYHPEEKEWQITNNVVVKYDKQSQQILQSVSVKNGKISQVWNKYHSDILEIDVLGDKLDLQY